MSASQSTVLDELWLAELWVLPELDGLELPAEFPDSALLSGFPDGSLGSGSCISPVASHAPSPALPTFQFDVRAAHSAEDTMCS